MASYQAPRREPLFDRDTQAMLEMRGKELIGLLLIGLGVLSAMMLYSFNPTDPSWFAATDEPAQNWLGKPGASLSSPLFVIAGVGVWGIPVAFIAWGIRFVIHRGQDRAMTRLIFAPVAIALLSTHVSTLPFTAWWSQSVGLGGLFGDSFNAAVLSILQEWGPVAFWIKVLSALSAAALVILGLYVLGFTKQELRQIAAFMLTGLVFTYSGILSLLGGAARGAQRGASAVQAAQSRRREARVERAAAEYDEPPMFDEQDYSRSANRTISFGNLFRRNEATEEPDYEPELVEATYDEQDENPLDPRIRAKISDVIRNRSLRAAQAPAAPSETMRMEPQLSRGLVPQPSVQTAEPVLTAPSVPLTPEPVHTEPAYEPDLTESFAEEPQFVPQPTPVSKAVVQHNQRRTAQSTQAKAEAQPSLFKEPSGADYDLPPLALLTNPTQIQRHHLSDEALEENARMLETVLDDYGIKGDIVSVRPGPVVTMYELEPAPGLKASRVIGLADDIARSMSALSARVSTVPGRSVIGIELPNEKREKVVLREILSTREFGDGKQTLPLALGKDIGGDPIVANLAKMPHLLIAGTTGSGKSVAINTMILSLLYKLTPDECRLIMIDPKMLELSVYDGIPHLLSPVVTDPKKAVVALKWVVGEMEERYRKMSKMGVRNIEGYNSRVQDALSKGEMFSRTVQTGFDEDTGEPIFETEELTPEKIPYIVVVVDEMADLMMVAGKEIEACIQRLAQMARASGIHLIMATQRPSVDVITGTIKANFPTRISFQVTSKVDSRTILGEMGAEQLLGMGDMLYMAGGGKITRCHGPFVSDEEVEEIVNHLKSYGPPEYVGNVVDGPDDDREADIDLVLGLGGNTNSEDALYDQAVAIVIKDRKCSTSYIQRKLAIGYNKAARLVEQMEDEGLVSASNHVGKREILLPEQN